MVTLAARDNADFRCAYHTRATHSTLTISQRSPVMPVGVTPESTLISVLTVGTAKQENKLSRQALHIHHFTRRSWNTDGRHEKKTWPTSPHRIDPGIICINLWGEAFVYWADELGLPAKADQRSSFQTQNGQSEAECLLLFWPRVFTGTC